MTEKNMQHLQSTIIDGSTLLYDIHWPSNGTVVDFVNNFKLVIARALHTNDVYLAFFIDIKLV